MLLWYIANFVDQCKWSMITSKSLGKFPPKKKRRDDDQQNPHGTKASCRCRRDHNYERVEISGRDVTLILHTYLIDRPIAFLRPFQRLGAQEPIGH